ncbi:MAG: PTS transporter subunit EIIC [Solobacterium sp.]|nr:PTS transporter subunit EIIC [Solobacterium sp.]
MAKMNYQQMSEDIIRLVGGAENIRKASHCFTRLRLDLLDGSKADIEAIKKVPGTKGVVVNNGQVQIIIGQNDIEEMYEVFCAASGKETSAAVDENLDSSNESKVNRFLNGLAQIFIPVFPALAAGGLLKALLIAAMFSGKFDTSTSTFTFLMMFSDAVFYFLPMFLAYSSAQVFKVKPILAMLIAAVLLHPTYTGMAEGGTLFGLSVPAVDYSSTVFPIIVSTLILSYLDRALRRVIPKSFAGLLVPLIDLLVMAPIMLIAVGPFVNWLSNTIGNAFIWLYNATGIIGGAVFGAVYPFLVFTGLHHAVVPVELQSLATLGYDPFLALCAAGNAAVAGASLMVAIDSRNPEFKGLALSSGITGLIGTTEPALYGILGILKRPFIATAIGGAVGGAIMSAFKVYGSGLGPVPLAGIGMFLGDKFLFYVIGVIASVAVAMVMTHIIRFEDVKLDNE